MALIVVVVLMIALQKFGLAHDRHLQGLKGMFTPEVVAICQNIQRRFMRYISKKLSITLIDTDRH